MYLIIKSQRNLYYDESWVIAKFLFLLLNIQMLHPNSWNPSSAPYSTPTTIIRLERKKMTLIVGTFSISYNIIE